MKFVYQVSTIHFQPKGGNTSPGNLGFFSSRKAAFEHNASCIADRLHRLHYSVTYLGGDICPPKDYPEVVLSRADIRSKEGLEERITVMQYRVYSKKGRGNDNSKRNQP